jgi:hypothetical protein
MCICWFFNIVANTVHIQELSVFLVKVFNVNCSAYNFDSESEVVCESDRQYDIVFVVWLC